jgi:nuclear transport factor 2 (NTF2) superfamily protein
MDRDGVARWMDAYRDAWISNDPAEVAALFTEDAEYSIEPFREPWRGQDEIVRKWTAGIKQQVALTYEVLALEGDLAVVRWHVLTQNQGDPVRTEYDGVLALTFAPDGRCRDHREWFFQRELH